MVVSAPEVAPLTPDDLVITPVNTLKEIDYVWHQAAAMGGMVIAVYKHDPESGDYIRDKDWGMLGSFAKTGPADPEKDTL